MSCCIPSYLVDIKLVLHIFDDKTNIKRMPFIETVTYHIIVVLT